MVEIGDLRLGSQLLEEIWNILHLRIQLKTENYLCICTCNPPGCCCLCPDSQADLKFEIEQRVRRV